MVTCRFGILRIQYSDAASHLLHLDQDFYSKIYYINPWYGLNCNFKFPLHNVNLLLLSIVNKFVTFYMILSYTVGIVFIGVLIKDQIKLTIVCFYIVFGLKTPLTLNTITYLINISYIGQYHIIIYNYVI
jgi:hypothetical protein